MTECVIFPSLVSNLILAFQLPCSMALLVPKTSLRSVGPIVQPPLVSSYPYHPLCIPKHPDSFPNLPTPSLHPLPSSLFWLLHTRQTLSPSFPNTEADYRIYPSYIFRQILNIIYMFLIRLQLDISVQSIENMPILYPLGILESDFYEYWKCAQLFAHWVHWSQMAGHIQNVLSMCSLGISGSHNRVYLKCIQHLITGHIGVTCWLWS